MEVQVKREQVSAYHKYKLFVDVPQGLSWSVRFTEIQLEDLKKEIKKRMDDRKDHVHYLEKAIFDKMKYDFNVSEVFTADMVSDQPEIIYAFSKELMVQMELDSYEPEQRTLEKQEG